MRELRNKLRVYRLVRAVDRELGLGPNDPRTPVELVAQAHARGDYAALWLIEGLGLRLTQRGRQRPTALDLFDAALPRSSLAMLHAGLGLALAVDMAETIETGASTLDAALARFEAEAHRRARAGYVGATLESLGLVVRVFHDRLRGEIGQRLAQRLDEHGGELHDAFWHGVGRGTYFVPRHFVPHTSRPWRALARTAPSERAHACMCGGLGWAIAMVNVEHPHIAERVLARLGGVQREAAIAGMCAGLLIRAESTPGPLAACWPPTIAARRGELQARLGDWRERGELGRAFTWARSDRQHQRPGPVLAS